MDELPARRPDWNRLFETAAAQEGLFTTQQAAEAGYSAQLLVHYVHDSLLFTDSSAIVEAPAPARA